MPGHRFSYLAYLLILACFACVSGRCVAQGYAGNNSAYGTPGLAPAPSVPAPGTFPVAGPLGGHAVPPSANSPNRATGPAPGFNAEEFRKGMALFKSKCTTCHDEKRVSAKARTWKQWQEVIDLMSAKLGAEISGGDAGSILYFLGTRDAAALNGNPIRQVVQEVRQRTPADDLKPEAQARPSATSPAETFDPNLVSAGDAAFQRKCISCHDANRSLEKTKNLGEWRATVQRMANKSNANISNSDVEPIATYLASLGTSQGGATAGAAGRAGGETPSMSVFASISPLWRGGGPDVQDPGFFPYMFAGVGWQQKNGPLSARITACTACHGFAEDLGNLCRLELLEMVGRVELTKFIDPSGTGNIKSGIEAGRFVVPFGAFSQQVNPGVYRTVSAPLIFNMGQRVREGNIGDPVLPMPYSDEGAVLNLWSGLFETASGDKFSTSADLYLVNGLIGNAGGISFDDSRHFVDNNGRPAYGARVTAGLSNLRAGVSFMSGRYNDLHDPGFANIPGLNYSLYGADLMYNYKDLIRFQTEFAARCNDKALVNDSGAFTSLTRDGAYGWYAELEARPQEKYPISVLLRYDMMGRDNQLPPDGSVLTTGTYQVHRYTGGVNFRLFSNSLLMLNYERWQFPHGLNSADVFGIRYNITF